ncbi:MAG: hypothetical protein ACI8YQ_001370 [Polaribacter sp.]|jgi:hypothetical protein
MNKTLLTSLMALLFVCATMQAQVKDKYQDKSSSLTTIVVKEDAANDMDILNDQFDLDDVGMHQVIRITTRQETPPEVATAALPSNDKIDIQSVTESMPVTNEAPIFTAAVENTQQETTEAPVSNTIKIVKEDRFEADLEEGIIATPAPVTLEEPIVRTTTQKSSRSSNYTATKSKSSKYQFKAFNKTFKKQKRKRVPKKRKRNKRCYRF